ncbi:TraR/DksA family transcriptional regulator [Herminiimonas fonticola]|uniref:RNA polymerase-binding transcription factor DksA n=1 Tax=Herminiimonas fonticola TaxID=303380 RepID=A0A4V3BW99_9BURK|nr:dksA: RNA polymerase-binding protein DksA [Herminiimonas fonticola]TDN94088.1 TraR/DksA family transcriptional regulator [Herminiimonas fonticola]
MNATVAKSAKSAKKTATKKAASTARAKPAGKTATAKSTAKSATKTLAEKNVKALKKVIKPAAKPAVKSAAKVAKKTPAKSAVKSAKVAAKTKVVAKKTAAAKNVKPAAKPAVKAKAAVKKAAVKAAAQPIKKVPASAPKATAVTANKDASRSGAGSSKKAVSAPVDKIEQAVVSKVREVATKSKAIPTADNDGPLLSEAQILKMGEKDYMNAAQLAFFKNRLQQLEKELLKNADETTEHLRETVLVPDPADRATIEEEHALELRTRDRERKLLKKVQQSIASIDAGDYGWCEETGEPIGVPRLLARPTATLSLEAQQRRELKQKLYGD